MDLTNKNKLLYSLLKYGEGLNPSEQEIRTIIDNSAGAGNCIFCGVYVCYLTKEYALKRKVNIKPRRSPYKGNLLLSESFMPIAAVCDSCYLDIDKLKGRCYNCYVVYKVHVLEINIHTFHKQTY